MGVDWKYVGVVIAAALYGFVLVALCFLPLLVVTHFIVKYW